MSRLALKQGHFSTILMSTQDCSTRSDSAKLAWRVKVASISPRPKPQQPGILAIRLLLAYPLGSNLRRVTDP